MLASATRSSKHEEFHLDLVTKGEGPPNVSVSAAAGFHSHRAAGAQPLMHRRQWELTTVHSADGAWLPL
jgi:hypothetical protein